MTAQPRSQGSLLGENPGNEVGDSPGNTVLCTFLTWNNKENLIKK